MLDRTSRIYASLRLLSQFSHKTCHFSFCGRLDTLVCIYLKFAPSHTNGDYIEFESMKVNTKRENISLEQTLAYIKYLNREKPFDREEIVVPTKDYEEQTVVKPKAPTPRERKKINLEEQPDEDLAKKINKNRAIKRIIQSAFQILQKFGNYQEGMGGESGDKSSEIQFNIYLKQYNRVLEMIHKREVQQIDSEASKAEQQEEVLQNIYEYTVVEDFREILPIAVLKDKISKTNLDIMIDKLSRCLVVLKPNELRIFESPVATESFKSIKLHEIENVDYHTQPYIFIVLTIQKDKERFNIYMQFESEKNQEKWDRALYCCFIGRKMKTKDKFFIIDYPEEDVKKKEKEETKKLASFNYDFNVKRSPLQKIYNEMKKPTPSQLSKDDHENDDKYSRSNTRGRRNNSIKSREELSQQKQEKPGSEAAMAGSKSFKFTGKESETNRQLEVQKSEKERRDELINRNKTDFINYNKEAQPVQVHTPNQKDFIERSNNMNGFAYNPDLERQPSIENAVGEEHEQENEKDILPDDIKQIHIIERKNVKGIILEKVKFFLNKAKIVFLKESSNAVKESQEKQESQESKEAREVDITAEYEAMRERELEYWDFNSSTGEKSERKVIKLISIKTCQRNAEKQQLLITHEKEITFTGNLQQLEEIMEWVQRIRKIYRQKLGVVLE